MTTIDKIKRRGYKIVTAMVWKDGVQEVGGYHLKKDGRHCGVFASPTRALKYVRKLLALALVVALVAGCCQRHYTYYPNGKNPKVASWKHR